MFMHEVESGYFTQLVFSTSDGLIPTATIFSKILASLMSENTFIHIILFFPLFCNYMCACVCVCVYVCVCVCVYVCMCV